MNKILHIVQFDEKFTNSYLNYFPKAFPEYEHFYLVIPKKTTVLKKNDYIIRNDIVYLNSLKDCYSKKIKIKIKESSKIIISGIFSIKYIFCLLSKKNLRKTYLHFWGGDYSSVLNITNWRLRLRKIFLTRLIKNCYAIVNLMDCEYIIIKDLFEISKKHFIARFPPRLENIIDYNSVIKSIVPVKNRILIGNSATESNNHLKVFEILEKFKNEDIEIFCPLSYGDMNYRKKVIEKGSKTFGNKFHPITEMMNLVDYSNFLQTCSLGIFYIERQQALGNIGALIRLQKKIFLLKETPLWNHYKNIGIEIFDIQNINNLSEEELFFFDNKLALKNQLIMNLDRKFEDAKKEWDFVLSE